MNEGPLTARQVDWCRRNIASFSEAWRSVKAADEHKAKVYAALGVEPGTVGVPSGEKEAQHS